MQKSLAQMAAGSLRQRDLGIPCERDPGNGKSPFDARSGFPLGPDLPPLDFLDCARVNLGPPGQVFLFLVETGAGGAYLAGGDNGSLQSSGREPQPSAIRA